MWIKLDGETITGHLSYPRVKYPEGSFTDHGYHAEIPEQILVNDSGSYIYKYSGEQLVLLSEQEINDHPNKTENTEVNKYELVIKYILERMALQEAIAHPQMPQKYVTRAQDKLAEVNQILQDLLGL